MRHVVSFEETNVVGNVYFVHHLSWQGRCREMFLKDHAPSVLGELERGFALVTTKVSCDYLAELVAFDEIVVRMRLGELTQGRMRLDFDYVRTSGDTEELIARGEQHVACMQYEGEELRPAPVPAALRDALEPYRYAESGSS